MKWENTKKQGNIRWVTVNAALIALMVVVFIVFANIAMLHSERKAADSAEKHLEICNTAVSSVIHCNVNLVHHLCDTLDFSEETGFVPDEKTFERFAYINDFSHVVMSDRDGLVTLPGYGLFNFSGRSGYTAAQNGNVYVGDPEYDVFKKVMVVPIAAPLQKNGITYNVLYGVKYVDQLEAEIHEACSAQDGEYYIINNKGKIIFSSENSRWKSGEDLLVNFSEIENVSSQNVADIAAALYENTQAEVAVRGIWGGKYMLNMQPLDANKRWSIVYTQDISGFMPGHRFALLSILCVATVIAIGIFMLVFNGKNTMKKQDEIEKTAVTDTLTGILNLNGFFEMSYKGLKSGENDVLTAVRLDIRDFKLINDKYGFVNGDNVLKQTAKTLTECMENAGFAARISADNFVFVKNDDGIKFVENILEKLISDIKSNVSDAVGRDTAFNIGVYRIMDITESMVSVIDKCNIAIKVSKTEMPNTIIYYNDSVMDTILEKRSMEHNMREALENEEFKIYIQPKVRIKDRRMTGGEALVRWDNPNMGFLSPDSFIPLFEKNGFIAELDLYVIEKVMQRLEMLQCSGIKPLPISVNISRVTLSRPDFMAKIKQLTDKYKSVRGLIELEITENVFSDDYRYITDILKKLHDLGMVIVMDDFGSGYSSLKLFRDIPFDVLKLDRSFFGESIASNRAEIIIRSVVEMARRIKVQVVCEGVETEEQVALLESIHCDIAQGFYFAQPMPLLKYEILQENELSGLGFETNA